MLFYINKKTSVTKFRVQRCNLSKVECAYVYVTLQICGYEKIYETDPNSKHIYKLELSPVNFVIKKA